MEPCWTPPPSCMSLYVFKCVHICMHACTWKLEVNVMCHPQPFSTHFFFFERQDLSLNMKLTNSARARYMGGELYVSACLPPASLPSLGLDCLAFTWVLGSDYGSSCLYRKYLSNWSISAASPSPTLLLLSTFPVRVGPITLALPPYRAFDTEPSNLPLCGLLLRAECSTRSFHLSILSVQM